MASTASAATTASTSANSACLTSSRSATASITTAHPPRSATDSADREPGRGGRCLVGVEPALGRERVQLAPQPVHRGRGSALAHVQQPHRVAGLRGDERDPGAHRAGADDGDRGVGLDGRHLGSSSVRTGTSGAARVERMSAEPHAGTYAHEAVLPHPHPVPEAAPAGRPRAGRQAPRGARRGPRRGHQSGVPVPLSRVAVPTGLRRGRGRGGRAGVRGPPDPRVRRARRPAGHRRPGGRRGLAVRPDAADQLPAPGRRTACWPRRRTRSRPGATPAPRCGPPSASRRWTGSTPARSRWRTP